MTYKLCDLNTPVNCAQTTATVTVIPAVSSISGTVFTDLAADGQLSPADPKLAGWIVQVVKEGQVVASTTTDANGFYQVNNILSGPGYSIVFRSPDNNVVYNVIGNLTLGNSAVVANVNQPIDPSGVVYDSVTRQVLSGTTLSLLDGNGTPLPASCFIDPSQQSQTTGASGQYQFNIIPGAAAQCPTGKTLYKLGVAPKNGYSAPSTVLVPQSGAFDPTGLASPAKVAASATPPATGTQPVYYLSFKLQSGNPDVVFNNIPLDPFTTRAPLVVTKTSTKRTASVGDLIPYQITVFNTEAAQRGGVTVEDILPAGLKYVAKTATVNGVAAEPTSIGAQLTWASQIIPANASVTYNLVVVVGAGVSDGDKINTGLALNSADNSGISNRGTAVVTITPSAVFDCSDVIGKVYEDANRNGQQDTGERGLAGVRLATVNGQLVTTDQYGRYHIACAAVPDAIIGSNFVLKIDTRTLPSGYAVVQDNPQSVRLTRGKMGEINFGVAAQPRTTIALTAEAFAAGSVDLKADYAQQIQALPATLAGDQPIVVLNYTLAKGEDPGLAAQRMQAIADHLVNKLRTINGKSTLTVETNMSRTTGVAGRE